MQKAKTAEKTIKAAAMTSTSKTTISNSHFLIQGAHHKMRPFFFNSEGKLPHSSGLLESPGDLRTPD
jgi:hypothetical protein